MHNMRMAIKHATPGPERMHRSGGVAAWHSDIRSRVLLMGKRPPNWVKRNYALGVRKATQTNSDQMKGNYALGVRKETH